MSEMEKCLTTLTKIVSVGMLTAGVAVGGVFAVAKQNEWAKAKPWFTIKPQPIVIKQVEFKPIQYNPQFMAAPTFGGQYKPVKLNTPQTYRPPQTPRGNR